MSILFGLAIGDLLLDLDRLLSRRREVTWYGLPIIAALMTCIALIAGWWDLYDTLTDTPVQTIADFLPHFAKLVLLFLIAAAVFPSHATDRLDLKRYYFDNSRYFYSLWCLLLLVIIALGFMRFGIDARRGMGLVALRFGMFAVLAWTKIPVIHWLFVPVLAAMLCWMWVTTSL